MTPYQQIEFKFTTIHKLHTNDETKFAELDFHFAFERIQDLNYVLWLISFLETINQQRLSQPENQVGDCLLFSKR